MSRHFITTPPRLTECSRCKRTMIDGTDSGVPYRVDAIPLTLQGELAARVSGRATYRTVHKDSFMSVVYRTVGDIKRETGGPVVANHSCAPVAVEHIHVADVAAIREFLDHCKPAAVEQDHDQLLLLNRELGAVVTELPTDPPF